MGSEKFGTQFWNAIILDRDKDTSRVAAICESPAPSAGKSVPGRIESASADGTYCDGGLLRSREISHLRLTEELNPAHQG
jgi:hypothetical protein